MPRSAERKVKCSQRQQGREIDEIFDVVGSDIVETLKNSSTSRVNNGLDAKGRF